MERYERSVLRGRRSPSFSSTLLDAIYRSIDAEVDEIDGAEVFLYRETTRKKQSIRSCNFQQEREERQEDIRQIMSLNPSNRSSSRMDRLAAERSLSERARRIADLDDGLRRPCRDNISAIFNSSSSSSYSSCGDFSSSDVESVLCGSGSSRSSSQSQIPIRVGLERSEKPTSFAKKKTRITEKDVESSPPKTKKEGFIKSKSRAASKIYDELKKSKYPNSPTVRIASFINSLFAARNAKKAKIVSGSPPSSEDLGRGEKLPRSAQASTCSSASSFSRSCLNKTPSSAGGRTVDGAKRSVRFGPVSIIFDEDCRPCAQKRHEERDPDPKLGNCPPKKSSAIGEELKFHLTEKSRRVEEAAKDLLKGYQQKSDLLDGVLRNLHDGDDEDDAASCSSSDLFELENLTAFDIERYREELPVYETTNLCRNQAIARGLIP